MARILLIGIISVVLLAACQSSDSSEGRVRFDPVEPLAASTSTTSTTVAERTEAPQWTARSIDTCVELSVGATIATTCAVAPGVSSWTVAGAHFVVARGDITLKNGVVIRADALGFAVGFLPSDTVPSGDVANACGRHDLAPGVAEHYPDSTVAWQRCEKRTCRARHPQQMQTRRYGRKSPVRHSRSVRPRPDPPV
jgi:hypothetical protein